MTPSDVIRAAFAAYRAQDVAAVEPLLAPTLLFTSPQDDHLDRAAYLARCFPTAGRFASQELLHVVDVDATSAFVLYEYELATGGRFRNVEFSTVVDGRLTEIQVFFGGAVPEPQR